MKKTYLTLTTLFLIIPTYLNAGVSGPAGNISPTVDPSATVPEPSIIALLGLGVAAIFLIKKFKK